MVMSQGTYTFLACFAGFWLVWALIVMLCCFCSFIQRRLKKRREERLREQCLRALEMEPLECLGPDGLGREPPTREPLHFCPPLTLSPPLHILHSLPQGSWASPQETDVFGKPPCYEEAVLMEDPPPPYCEVLADSRGGTNTKPSSRASRLEQQETETSKTPPVTVFSERGYSSLIRLPTARRWDSLGHLLSTMDLNHNTLPMEPLSLQAQATTTMPREGRTHTQPELGLRSIQGLRRLEQSCGLPTSFPLLGRSTAV
ncbi:proline-rich protein 7 [Oncorhynchus tshawytscha]|uniref:Proline-rich protein 7 n=1 Tax=Oncorhynchus tshawytscha TaxID=74940 RepID=A0AAZ3NT36_ONCTS|nr:proline-rich protein 7 [Oncorhynchus tshawytscha]